MASSAVERMKGSPPLPSGMVGPLSRESCVTTNEELRARHLDMIQSAISRFAQNSFVIKGWSVTIVTATFAFLNTQNKGPSELALLALAPTAIFWFLDAYYLRQERMYRQLFVQASHALREGGDTVPLFDMNAGAYRLEVPGWRRTAIALPVVAVPGMLSLLILGVYLVR
jgi:hypothetical protein